jgi:hypothetical protein
LSSHCSAGLLGLPARIGCPEGLRYQGGPVTTQLGPVLGAGSQVSWQAGRNARSTKCSFLPAYLLTSLPASFDGDRDGFGGGVAA